MKKILIFAILALFPIIAISQKWMPAAADKGQTFDSHEEFKRTDNYFPIDLLPDSLRNVAFHSDLRGRFLKKFRAQANVADGNEDPEQRILTLHTTDYGQLDSLLDINDGGSVHTLKVEGPMDSIDFKAIWSCAYNHRKLRTLDLANAQIQDKIVPDYALYDPVQYETGRVLKIKKIILPDDIVRLGKAAFPLSLLEEINIPKSLKEMGPSVFSWDMRLNCPIQLPEGMEGIPYDAFLNDYALTDVAPFPKSLKFIGQYAFYGTSVKEITLSEETEAIYSFAFIGTQISKIAIPETIKHLGAYIFNGCYNLVDVSLPSSMKSIPVGLFCQCGDLKKGVIPEDCEIIGKDAYRATGIENINLPESVQSIGSEAFYACPMGSVVLPSNLKEIGYDAFNSYYMKSVYCKGNVPPVCIEGSDQWESMGPFGDNQRAAKLELYVPLEAAGTYGSVWQWNQFGKIEEIDSFPSMGVTEYNVDPIGSPVCHDLMGRKISSPATGQMYIENGRKYISPAH